MTTENQPHLETPLEQGLNRLLLKLQELADGITLLEPAKGPSVKSLALQIPLEKWSLVAKELRTQFQFDMLADHAAIDWPQENKIELLYQLYSLTEGLHLMVSVSLDRRNPIAPSVYQLWPIAEWQEREVYDLFGVKYAGHPDLRRLFLEDDWKGFPLLKDYNDDFILEKPW